MMMTNNQIIDVWQTAPNNGWVDGVPLGGFAKQIFLSRNKDGRLECVYVGTNGELYHNWQTAPNNGWAGEHSLSVTASGVVVGENADGRLEAFYIKSDGSLCHIWQTAPGSASWSGEAAFPGTKAQSVAVGQNQDGRLEIFYIGQDAGLYHDWQVAPNGVWHGAEEFSVSAYVGNSYAGGAYDGGMYYIAVASNQDGRLEVFYSNAQGGGLRHMWQTAPNGLWSGEHKFSGNSAVQIAVGKNADGRLEAFYVGGNSDLYHNWQKSAGNQSWNGEERFAQNSAIQVSVGQNQDGCLEIFYVGTNNVIYHNWQTAPNGSWAGEEILGVSVEPFGTAVTVNSNADGRLEVLYLDQPYQPKTSTTSSGGTSSGGGGISGGGEAILSLNGPYYSPSDPTADVPFSATVFIPNTGTIASPAVTIQFYVDEQFNNSVQVASIAPGQTGSASFKFDSGLGADTYELEFELAQTGASISAQLVIMDDD
jgi:hypothetical protein